MCVCVCVCVCVCECVCVVCVMFLKPQFLALETKAGYSAYFKANDQREADFAVNGTHYGFPLPVGQPCAVLLNRVCTRFAFLPELSLRTLVQDVSVLIPVTACYPVNPGGAVAHEPRLRPRLPANCGGRRCPRQRQFPEVR